MRFIAEFWAFLRHRKKFWLLPILLALAVFAGLVAVAQPAVATLVYTLF